MTSPLGFSRGAKEDDVAGRSSRVRAAREICDRFAPVSTVTVAVAAVDQVAVGVVVRGGGAVVAVGVVVHPLVQMLVDVGVLVGVGVGVRMGMHEVAVAMLVTVHVAVRMGVAMLVGMGVRLAVVVIMAARLVVHRVLPQRSARSLGSDPRILRITVSPASTVILT